jgi:hypothetical protein
VRIRHAADLSEGSELPEAVDRIDDLDVALPANNRTCGRRWGQAGCQRPDASADFAEDGSAFQHNDIKAVSCPAQGTGEAANTGAGSDDGVTPVLRL